MSTISASSGRPSLLGTLRGEFDALQRQLGTGLKAETYGGLGSGRVGSLDIRAKLAALQGADAAIDGAGTRLKVMDATLTRLADMRTETAKNLLPGSILAGADGRALVRSTAEARLKEAIDLLNQDVAGRHLFAGRATDTAPVESYDRIMDGDPATGRDGLKTLINERKSADLGDGLGRLSLSSSAGTVALSESAAPGGQPLPFGFHLAATASSGSAIGASAPAGTPPSIALTVTGTPADGDTVSLTLGLPDGTSQQVTLTARSNPGDEVGAFGISASPADTATKLAAALDRTLRATAGTALAASSAQVAAADFFAGSSTNPPRRVSGPPFGTATGFEPVTSARAAVLWYKGDDQAASARETASVRVDATSSVAVGAQANEAPIRDLLTSLGVLAAESFGSSAGEGARYAALAGRVSAAVAPDAGTPSIQGMAAELGLAQTSLTAAKERHHASAAMLADALSGLEQADPEATATALLSLQTRLQASYQVTAMMSRLSLVSYL